jgi:two-component system NtrC family sensor kinase
MFGLLSLRHKFFIALSVLTGVPLLVLLFGAVEQMEKEITVRTEAEMHGTLDKMAGEVGLILNNQKAIANGLARIPAIQKFAEFTHYSSIKHNLPQYQHLAEELQTFFLNYQHAVPSIQAIRFMSPNGKSLVKVKEGKPVEASHLDPATGLPFVADQANRKFFRSAIEEGAGVVMSDFELGRVSVDADFCPAMVRYSVPVRDEVDKLLGVLVVNMWGTRLDKTIEAALGGNNATAYIVELNPGSQRDGIYLYHPDNSKRFANQLGSDYRFSNTVSKSDWKKIHQSEKSGSLFQPNGRMIFYRKLSPYPDRSSQWLLVMEADSADVYAPINNMRESIWMLLASLLFISLLLAGWASGRLTGPVHRLAEIIHRYADGDRAARFDESDVQGDEIGRAGTAFNYLAERLELTEKEREEAVRAACQSERLAALGQLSAGIGHEINNPLMNIMSLASLIEESLPDKDSEAANDLELLKKECERCARIVQGVLSFAREKKPSYVSFDMSELLPETLDLLRHRIESSNLKLVTDVESPLLMSGDVGLLQQVLVNIILNAIQASPEGSVLKIAARIKDENIEIHIIDHGHGIADTDYSKIFDPFFTTKEEGQGTGLGLSVSYGIIERHNGVLKIRNHKNGGVEVYILLPVEQQQENDKASTDYMEAANA